MKLAVAYLLAISIAETITVLVQPVWGIIAYILILFALVVHAALTSQRPQQQIFLSVALVPLIRVISLAMPLATIPQIWWYPIIYVPLLGAAIMVMRVLGYKAKDVGLIFGPLRSQFAVPFTGLAFGVIEYLIVRPEAEVVNPVLLQTWPLSAFLLLTCTGFVEEFIFRGILQHSAEESFGSWQGIIYVSLLFAVVHLIHQSLLDLIFVFVVAVFFGWIVKKTGSLLGVTLAHGVTNIVLFLVAPVLF
ncbi:MAG: type II CAAX endopeptidase family protein [Chloroflexota bacterium]